MPPYVLVLKVLPEVDLKVIVGCCHLPLQTQSSTRTSIDV